jgi:hypothetical protein
MRLVGQPVQTKRLRTLRKRVLGSPASNSGALHDKDISSMLHLWGKLPATTMPANGGASFYVL